MKSGAIFPLLVFVVLVVFLAIGLKLNPREVPSPFVGKPLPAFELPELMAEGETIAPKDMLGKVWMLNVFASWCFACRAEHEVITQFVKRENLPVLGLNYKDEASNAKEWLRQLGNPYDAIAFDFEGKVGIDLGVYGVPETFIIDQQGIVRYKLTGPVSETSARDELLPVIMKLRQGQG